MHPLLSAPNLSVFTNSNVLALLNQLVLFFQYCIGAHSIFIQLYSPASSPPHQATTNTEVKRGLTNYHRQNSIPQNSCYKVAHIPFQPFETTPGAKTNLHRERDRIRRLHVPYSLVSTSKKEKGRGRGDIHMLSLRRLPTLPKRSQSLHLPPDNSFHTPQSPASTPSSRDSPSTV